MVHKKKKRSVNPQPFEPSSNDLEISNAFTREKRARIIVRNLPFANLSEDLVREVFSEYGNIIDVSLLKKKDGKYVGCGFVEYDRRQSAAKAIIKGNAKEISGRNIIVDWALPKNTFVEKVQQFNAITNIKKEETGSDSENFENGTVAFSIDKKPNRKFKSKKGDDYTESMSEGDDDFDDEMNDEDDNEGEKPKRESNDVEEGKTVFIKNVPFSATNDDVKKCFQAYGPVYYGLICVDKLTEHSKGLAFVKFKEKESADKAINDNGNIFLKDQRLEVTQAVSRTKLEEEKKLKKLKTKDSRNLYLVREGVVMAGSPAAATVSAPDMAKRLQIEQWKTQILRNLNMFVSKTRLVVHNLPPSYDDVKLRDMIVKYSLPSAVVKEARVMQDRKKFDGQGQPLSKEVGFVTFTSHEDALHTLRQINNNPTVFTASRRPIVSFSIENRQILNLKQKRLEKSKAKVMGESKGDKAKGLEKLNRKQRRFLRRKEKLIKLRQDAKKLKKERGETKAEKKASKAHKALGTSLIQKKTLGIERNMPSGSDSKQARKRKKFKESKPETSVKKAKVAAALEDFGGVHSVPGKKLKMRSRLKLKKQAEIHKRRLKEVKKIKKTQKDVAEKKRNIRQREPGVKKKKKSFDNDAKFSKLISSYKKKIESAASFKKWYEA